MRRADSQHTAWRFDTAFRTAIAGARGPGPAQYAHSSATSRSRRTKDRQLWKAQRKRRFAQSSAGRALHVPVSVAGARPSRSCPRRTRASHPRRSPAAGRGARPASTHARRPCTARRRRTCAGCRPPARSDRVLVGLSEPSVARRAPGPRRERRREPPQYVAELVVRPVAVDVRPRPDLPPPQQPAVPGEQHPPLPPRAWRAPGRRCPRSRTPRRPRAAAAGGPACPGARRAGTAAAPRAPAAAARPRSPRRVRRRAARRTPPPPGRRRQPARLGERNAQRLDDVPERRGPVAATTVLRRVAEPGRRGAAQGRNSGEFRSVHAASMPAPDDHRPRGFMPAARGRVRVREVLAGFTAIISRPALSALLVVQEHPPTRILTMSCVHPALAAEPVGPVIPPPARGRAWGQGLWSCSRCAGPPPRPHPRREPRPAPSWARDRRLPRRPSCVPSRSAGPPWRRRFDPRRVRAYPRWAAAIWSAALFR